MSDSNVSVFLTGKKISTFFNDWVSRTETLSHDVSQILDQVNAPEWLKSTIPKAYDDSVFLGGWKTAIQEIYDKHIGNKTELLKQLETVYFWDYATFGYETKQFEDLFQKLK